MNTTAGRGRIAWVDRFLNARSIRTKLGLGFGVLLALGLVNIVVYYWGAHQRARAFQDLQRATERQVIILEVTDLLEDQKVMVDLVAGVLGVEAAAPPDAAARERFTAGVDTITVRLEAMLERADPEDRPPLAALLDKTGRLGASWKQFYTYQWTEPARAVEELYARADPLAQELLAVDLPAAVQREKEALAAVNAQFIETDLAFQRIAWASLVLSALLGGLLAFLISRNLLGAISALKAGAEAIGAGRLDHRIRIENRDELRDVADSFNEMADRLDQRTAEVEAQRDYLTRALEHLKATQAQLIQAEKMASLGQLTAGIAHEIKNPLNFVNNFAVLTAELVEELEAELAAVVDRPVAEVRDDLEAILADLKLNAGKINEHGRRADAIVRSMLLHSRGTPGQHLETDLNALLDEYVNLSYHGMRAQRMDFNVTIERDYDPAVGAIRVIPQELGRVFINLLNNAFYAVHERKGRSNGQLDGRYAPTVRVRTRRLSHVVEVRVEDNGAGIPEAVKGRIFEPFYTTKPTGEGTGLGLSLSYDIVVRGHGGTLDVESEEGGGTTFVITLPG